MCPVPGVVCTVVRVKHIVSCVLKVLCSLLGFFHITAYLNVLLAGHCTVAEALKLGLYGVTKGNGIILAASFLIGGTIAGLVICDKKSDSFIFLGKGALSMLPAVFLIAIASSIKLVMEESGIIDTIMHYIISLLDGKSKFVTIVLIYLLILVLQVFIGSSSAKIMLVMPIIVPICASIGISPSIVILAYCMADGFTDVILPTNPVLLVGLSMANVSYGKWFKWTWKLQLFVLTITLLILLFATGIGY
jgi:uncharacterized ion transporter superfamily protein YfcC